MSETVELSGSALIGADTTLIPLYMSQSLPKKVCLGRREPLAQPPVLKLAAYLAAPGEYAAPPPRSTSWRVKAAQSLGRMYLNDQLGCCVISGKLHNLGIWSANDHDHQPPGEVVATDQEVKQQYQQICGPGDNG